VSEPPDTIYGLLRRGAARWPDRELVVWPDATPWTWADALAEASRAAQVLAAHGVGAGDRVMVLLPNGAGWLRAWWGATLLGAVVAPVNPAFRGLVLTSLIERVEPAVIVTADPAVDGPVLHPDALGLTAGPSEFPELDDPPDPWDPHCVLMTSGTTGPSKASISTNIAVCHFARWLVDRCRVGPGDTFQADMPWFHLSAFGPVIQMMRVGGRFAVREAPAMTAYWASARAMGSTFAVAPGTVAEFLEHRPPSDDDRDHAMRFMVCSPLPSDPAGFADRFGLEGLCTAYGSTEASIPLIQPLDVACRTGSCGVARDGFEVRVVDEHDLPVPIGTVGELVVRTDQPWLLSQGYLGDDAATVRLFRNGWLHTGDAVRADADGYLYFHDRYKDALRRRGENISSFDVERDVAAYPGVAEVACVAAPGEYGDDEVKVFVVPATGAELDLEDLLAFLAGRMAYFMVPRYFELVDDLPKTASTRVRKHELRARGNSATTWDREAAGWRVTRAGLVRDT
jgi:crotonobetaine/carnitine-CoA ligase